MKKIFTLIGITAGLALTANGQSPTPGKTYIMQSTVRNKGYKAEGQLTGKAVDSVNRTITYFDGLGRPLQTVQWKASPAQKDIVQLFEYDSFGREVKKYQPYAEYTSNDASLKPSAISQQADFYKLTGWDANIPKTPYPYAMTVPEASPMSRVLQQGAPGAVWQPYDAGVPGSGHTVKMTYTTNTIGEVQLWTVGTSGASTSATYGTGKLTKTITKDENWTSGKTGTVAEFKDAEGRVILKRMWASPTDSLSTFYVYDSYSNLRYVIPPGVNTLSVTSFAESDAVFNNFIYGYHYDKRKRLIEKKVPGKGWEKMVYNKLDQLVLSQDAVQSAANKWSFIKYDAQGRTILTGVISSSTGQAAWQSTFDALSINWEARDNTNASLTGTGYTNNTLPAHSIVDRYHTISYYDDYSFYGNSGTYDPALTVSDRTTGLPTATKVNILNTSVMLLTVMYYDNEGRLVESRGQNQLAGGYERVKNTYNFPGELTTTTREHTFGATTTTILNKFSYDHQGRKINTKSKINANAEIVLSRMEYNELGMLKKKNLHSTDSVTFYQNTKFAYNERGWLKGSNSAQFNMWLAYDTLSNPQYNGNIAVQKWGASYANQFLYTYDALNRLTSGASTGIAMSEALTYDKMGNIVTMNRDAAGTATYSYSGNRLSSISGGGLTTGSYGYDVNGNATTDGRNAMTLKYNVLNLIDSAYKSGTNLGYRYTATGQKLRKIANGTVTQYVNGIQYTGTTQDFIQTQEGRAVRSGTDYIYNYDLTDHLGNVRYTFDIYAGAVRKLQEDNYYPFGKQKVATGGTNKYLYNGKELQSELGQYDYGARFYDPVIGRWNSVDPMAEKYINFTPYTYAVNNPLLYIDPDGNEIVGVTKEDAQKFKDDIYNILSGDKLAGIRALIAVKGSKFDKIDKDVLGKVTADLELSTDQKTYLDILVGAINSDDTHKIEYLSGDFTSREGATAFKDYMNNVQKGVGDMMLNGDGNLSVKIVKNSGDGLNVSTKRGSHSFIGASKTGKDRAITSGHEVLGHGISSAKKKTVAENNANAIRTDNLIRRILGLPERDGSDHGGYKEGHIIDPSKLPEQ